MENNTQPITNILADCLDAVRAGKMSPEECAARYPDHAAELTVLLQAAHTVEQRAVVQPSPAFRQAARARLLQKLPDQPSVVTNGGFLRHIGQILNTKQRRFAMNILAILAVLAATALGGGGVVYASGDALPGDALYGVKTGVEGAQLALADDAQDVNLYNQFLAERAAEMGQLVETGRFDDLTSAAERYEQNLTAMVQTMLENPEVGEMLMEQVRLAQQERLQTMTQLMERTPEENRARIRQVLNAEAQQLSPGLGEPGHGPGEPGMGAGESGQSENEPGQGPGQAGGSEESQNGASGQNQGESGQGQGGSGQGQGGQPDAGTGEPQGNSQPGTGSDQGSSQGSSQSGNGQSSNQGDSQGSDQDNNSQSGNGQSDDQGNGQSGDQGGNGGGNK